MPASITPCITDSASKAYVGSACLNTWMAFADASPWSLTSKKASTERCVITPSDVLRADCVDKAMHIMNTYQSKYKTCSKRLLLKRWVFERASQGSNRPIDKIATERCHLLVHKCSEQSREGEQKYKPKQIERIEKLRT